MNEITKDIINKFKEGLEDFAVDMRKAGGSDLEIQGAILKHVDIKKTQFHKSKKGLSLFADVFQKLKLDSNVEGKLYDKLQIEKIPFKPQVKIGAYRVDFLINDYLIFEGDGPQHKETMEYDKKRDQFLESLGYKVIRLPWNVVEIATQAVIDEIKSIISEGAPQ